MAYLAKGECPARFHSPVRQQEYTYFIKKQKELETSLAQAEKEYKRNKNLFDKKVISEEEYDKYYFQYQSRQNELASLIQSQLSTWQADLNTYRNSRSEMNTTLKQELKDKELYIVPAYTGEAVYRQDSHWQLSARIPHCVWRYMLLLEISVL